ncbi:peptidylprolyl isomerase [Acetobacter fallax]|uniref:Peptidylprolyl isomerase n=1 Tax=Acetobacter fallax TaxID=1737473 RepID=A0ABX0K658_9PROT|nr:peptidylprolyl isomerase [Acetobacter fallax]NHO31870.1 peptidylprolyl isomerase [Acetobacter fallax]NHO35367.1 peptidylprolyl isomerase [Acetobacter fallax]
MISFLRHFVVDSWIGRVLALVIFLAFVGWGIGDVISGMADDPATVATVGSRKITTRDLAAALQAEMPRMAQRMGAPDPSQMPPQFRLQMAQEVLQRLIGQAQVLESGSQYGLVVPDQAVRDEIFAMPYFKGINGSFDRNLFNSKLAQAGMTEKRLISLVHDDLAGRAIMDPVAAGAHISDLVVSRIYGFETETRDLDILHIPFASQTAPANPDDAVLRRYYTNHPWMFRSPEYRHARIIVLSPDTVAPQIPATDEEMHRLYDAQAQRFHAPELRTIQLITAPDETTAQAITTIWKGGADWAQVQAAAKGSAAVEFTDTRASALPSDTLQKIVFSAPVDAVEGPQKTETGWVIFRVTKVTPPHDTSFGDAKATLHDEIVKARAPDAISSRVPKLQDAIAGGGLDSIPADLGAAAASGSLDAHGMTRDGEPAPLPASGPLRDAVVAKIFAQVKGAPPQLVEATTPPEKPGQQPGPSLGWYAVSVDDIVPGQQEPFEAVRDRVMTAWQADARKHAADQQATALYLASRDHGGLAASAPAGSPVQKDVMLSRVRPPAGLSQQLMEAVMHMPAGQSFMGEDADSFIVLTVTGIRHPDPKTDTLGYSRVRDGMTESLSSDLTSAFIHSLDGRFKAKIMPAGVKAALSQAGYGDGT